MKRKLFENDSRQVKFRAETKLNVQPAVNNQTSEIPKFNTEFIGTTNLFNSLSITGEITYNYTTMKSIIKECLSQSTNNQFTNTKVIHIHEIKNHFITFHLPHNLNLADLLDEATFESNFSLAFQKQLALVEFKNKIMPKLKIRINAIKNSSNIKNISSDDLTYFRQIICFAFPYLFNLTFPECACYPQNLNQLLLWRSGIKMNCINGAGCESFIKYNPKFYDSLFVGRCNSYSNISVIQNIININSKGNVTLNIDNGIFSLLKSLEKEVSIKN